MMTQVLSPDALTTASLASGSTRLVIFTTTKPWACKIGHIGFSYSVVGRICIDLLGQALVRSEGPDGRRHQGMYAYLVLCESIQAEAVEENHLPLASSDSQAVPAWAV